MRAQGRLCCCAACCSSRMPHGQHARMVFHLAMLRNPAAYRAQLHSLNPVPCCSGGPARPGAAVLWLAAGGRCVLGVGLPGAARWARCAVPRCAALCRAGHHSLLLRFKADACTLGAAGRALHFCKHLEFMPCSPLSPRPSILPSRPVLQTCCLWTLATPRCATSQLTRPRSGRPCRCPPSLFPMAPGLRWPAPLKALRKSWQGSGSWRPPARRQRVRAGLWTPGVEAWG